MNRTLTKSRDLNEREQNNFMLSRDRIDKSSTYMEGETGIKSPNNFQQTSKSKINLLQDTSRDLLNSKRSDFKKGLKL